MKSYQNPASFRLSRIYAEGWNVARGPEAADKVNPYSAEPERSRWQAGFASAQTAPIGKRR